MGTQTRRSMGGNEQVDEELALADGYLYGVAGQGGVCTF